MTDEHTMLSAGAKEDAPGPHGEPAEPRLRGAGTALREAVLAAGRHRHLAHTILHHRGTCLTH